MESLKKMIQESRSFPRDIRILRMNLIAEMRMVV